MHCTCHVVKSITLVYIYIYIYIYIYVCIFSCLGVPGVIPARFTEGLEPKHCALSLVGEPIMYPKINSFVDMLHDKGISTFLVTNAQFPDAIK